MNQENRQPLETRGIIEQVLPRAMYRVRLEGGRTVRASLAPSAKHAIVRLVAGCQVLLRTYPGDPHRAQITQPASQP